MKIFNRKRTLATLILVLGVASCTKKLDLFPTNDLTPDKVFSTPQGYKNALAGVYAAYNITSSGGPDANFSDVAGIDNGFSDFSRLYWNVQELTTDEAVTRWTGDAGLTDFHFMNWTADNVFTKGLYYRSIYQITLCNEFIRESTPEKLASRNITGSEATNIANYRNEARFLRAYQYWVLMDLFGNPPFVTENDKIGTLPKQILRADLFKYIESELKAIETSMIAHRTNEYGRVDKGAPQALLARMYLNAKVYTGTENFADAITYSKKIIDAGYTLVNDPRLLFLADNHLNTTENIVTIPYDGNRSQSNGGTTFLINCAIGGSMDAAASGMFDNTSWAGMRTTPQIIDLYVDLTFNSDRRGFHFYRNGQSRDIVDFYAFNNGFAVTKFKNVTRTGANGNNRRYADTDLPLFRLAEMYLIYAEAHLRKTSVGDRATALGYINLLRTRAYGNASGNILDSELTLDNILKERARELFWESQRRTDLIRYDMFTESTYLWSWKGGVKDGTSVPAFRKLFPLPIADLTVNPNLVQNPGY